MSLDSISEIPYEQIPQEDPAKKEKSGFPVGATIFIAIIATYLLLLKYPIRIYPPKEMSLEENIQIQFLCSYGLASDHLIEDTRETKATLQFKEQKLVSREQIDFAFVIDFPGARDETNAEIIQNAFTKALPLLGYQDRLSTLIFDGGSSEEPMYNFVPLANTTEENKNIIFSNIGGEFSAKKSTATYQGLPTAIKLLNQRKNVTSVTGIILYTVKCNYRQINEILLGLKSPHAFLYCSQPSPNPRPDNDYSRAPSHHALEEVFVKSLTELQHSLFGNVEFFVKAEQSEFFQGVEIVKAEFAKEEEGDFWGESRMFIGRNLTLFPERQKYFDFGVKFPNATQPLPEIPAEVPLVSCEMVLTLLNGTQITKNKDWKLEVW